MQDFEAEQWFHPDQDLATTPKLNWKPHCNSIAFGIGYKSVRQVSSMTFRPNNGSVITEIGPRLQNSTDYSAPAVSWRIVKLQFLDPYYLINDLGTAQLSNAVCTLGLILRSCLDFLHLYQVCFQTKRTFKQQKLHHFVSTVTNFIIIIKCPTLGKL